MSLQKERKRETKLAIWEIGYAERKSLTCKDKATFKWVMWERMVHRRSWVPFYRGWKEDDRRIGWSPIATDRRPIWQQNIRRSGALTISSIRLSFVSTQTGPRSTTRIGELSLPVSRKKNRQFVECTDHNPTRKTNISYASDPKEYTHRYERRVWIRQDPLFRPTFIEVGIRRVYQSKDRLNETFYQFPDKCILKSLHCNNHRWYSYYHMERRFCWKI